MSAHRPISVYLNLPHIVNIHIYIYIYIYIRAKYLSAERSFQNKVTRLTSKYDYAVVNRFMQQHHIEIERGSYEIVSKNDPSAILTYLNNFTPTAHKQPQCKIKVANKKLQSENLFEECNTVFKQYSQIRNDQNASNEEVLHFANRMLICEIKLQLIC